MVADIGGIGVQLLGEFNQHRGDFLARRIFNSRVTFFIQELYDFLSQSLLLLLLDVLDNSLCFVSVNHTIFSFSIQN